MPPKIIEKDQNFMIFDVNLKGAKLVYCTAHNEDFMGKKILKKSNLNVIVRLEKYLTIVDLAF